MKGIFKIPLAVFFILLLSSLSEPAWGADWPTYRGDAIRSGVSSESLSLPLDKKWEYDIGRSGHSSPIVANNTVFVGANNGYLYALAVDSPTLKWSFPTGGSIRGAPLYLNGVVYLGSTNGKLYALNAVSGASAYAWSPFDTATQGGGAILSSLVTDGTNIYFGTENGRVFAVNAASGVRAWYYDASRFSYSSPSLVLSPQFNALFFSSYDGVVYSISTAGSLRWTYPVAGDNFEYSSPAVVGGVVYVGSNNGIIYAIAANNGSLNWSYDVGSDVIASPAVTADTVYVGSLEGNFYALGTTGGQKGKLRWSYRSGSQIESSAVVSGSSVFVGGKNLLFVLDTSTGDFRWSYGVGQEVVSPAIANGWLYLASDKLYAFQPTPIAMAMVEKWKFNTGSTITRSGVAVDGGVTYVGTDDGYLYAINPDGTQKWRFSTGGSVVFSTPVVAAGVVYFGAENSLFYAVNTSDGILKWSKPLSGPNARAISPPTVADGVVYLGASNGYLYALNATNGNEVWTPYYVGSTAYGLTSPLVDAVNNRIYFAYGNKRLLALDRPSGSLVWQANLLGDNHSENPSSILQVGNTLYAGGYGYIHAFDLSGNQKWAYRAYGTGALEAGFVEWQGILIGAGFDGKVVALNTADATLRWEYAVKGVPGKPFVWQDVVFVMTNGFRVYALSMEDGRLRFEYAGNFNPLFPVVTGGLLYLGSRDGRVYSEDIDNYSMNVSASLGGTILTVYGDRLEIPAGALSANTTITINISLNDQSGEGVVALPRKYRFRPDGTNFSSPATAKFAYKTSDLQGVDPNTVKVYVWDSLASIWTASGGTANLSNKTIDVSLNHFSDYALFGGEPELNFPVLAATYLYGTAVTFRYSAFDPSRVTGVAGYLNDQPIESGTQIKLARLGTNIFRVVGTKAGDGEVSQSITFGVVYALDWLSPLTVTIFITGDTIPIKFRANDFAGNFVANETVTIEVVDGLGHSTETFTTSKNNVYIKISESHYLVNLDTSKYSWIVPGGSYQIKVSFNGLPYPPYSFFFF